MLKKFVDFLKNEKAYEDYCQKFEPMTNLILLNPDEYITAGISWTLRDAEYWNSLNRKWLNVIGTV